MQANMIEFTQYVLPHGRKRAQYISMPLDICKMAEEIQANGYVFECEVLTTGQVSLTITDPQEEYDVDIMIVDNGPDVVTAVETLIERFYHGGGLK